MDIYNGVNATTQSVYDSYNNFIFSQENRVFQKMTKRIELYQKVNHLVGDVWEYGVFKGSGMALWLKLKNMYEPHSVTKVVGVDLFHPEGLLETLEGDEKSRMDDVLTRVDTSDLSVQSVRDRLQNVNKKDMMLLKGDAAEVTKEYLSKSPGVRVKLLYMDLDLGDVTYEVLNYMWDRVVENGIVVLDEYAYHSWTESNGVDKFLKQIKGQYTIFQTNIDAPTMYLQKCT